MNKENFIFAKGFNNPSHSLGSSLRRAFVTWFIASVPGEQTFAIWVTPDPWKNLIKITILRKRRKGLVASRPANYLHPPWRSGKYNGWCEKTVRGQIYIYIVADIVGRDVSHGLSSINARYGDISRTSRVDSYKRSPSRWKGTIGIMRRIYFHPPENSRNIGAVN